MKQACEYNTKQNIKKSWAPGSDYLSSNLSSASYSLILAWLYNFYMPRAYVLSHFSHVWLFVTPWTVTHQAPLSMGVFRQEYWSGLCPPPGDLPDPGIKPGSPALQVDSLPLSHQGSPYVPYKPLFL